MCQHKKYLIKISSPFLNIKHEQIITSLISHNNETHTQDTFSLLNYK